MISRGYNLADDRTCNLTRRTDQPGTGARLGPLDDYGGPAATMALLPASPAIDRGISDALPGDQRGDPRPIDFPWVPNAPGGDGADVGAFERQALASNRFRFRKLTRNLRRGIARQRIGLASSGRVILRRNNRVRRFARRVDGRGVVAVRGAPARPGPAQTRPRRRGQASGGGPGPRPHHLQPPGRPAANQDQAPPAGQGWRPVVVPAHADEER